MKEHLSMVGGLVVGVWGGRRREKRRKKEKEKKFPPNSHIQKSFSKNSSMLCSEVFYKHPKNTPSKWGHQSVAHCVRFRSDDLFHDNGQVPSLVCVLYNV